MDEAKKLLPRQLTEGEALGDRVREIRARLLEGAGLKPELEYDLTRLFASNEVSARTTVPLLAVTLASVLWAPPLQAGAWVALVLAMKLFMVAACLNFLSRARSEVSVARWRRRFTWLNLATGATWGGIAALGLGAADAAGHVFLLISLVALLAIRIFASGGSLGLWAATVPLTLAVAARLAAEGEPFHLGMAAIAVGLHACFIRIHRGRDYAANIHDSGRHLLQLIDGIPDRSRIEAGRDVLQESPGRLAGVGKVFVSYRRDDARDMAARIRDRLADTFGEANVFMDVDNLLPGQRFDKELEKALDQTDVFLAVIGRRWLELLRERQTSGERDYVREEIAGALQRGIVVIPVLIERTPLPESDALSDDIRDLALHQIHEIAHARFGRDVTELIEAIRLARKAVRRSGEVDVRGSAGRRLSAWPR